VLREECDGLRRRREKAFQTLPIEWIEELEAGLVYQLGYVGVLRADWYGHAQRGEAGGGEEDGAGAGLAPGSMR
jgi:hypothetical protein